MNTFDKNGYAENGDIRLQLKARSRFTYSKDRRYIQFQIEVKHYYLWVNEAYPIFLVLYDASNNKAYYLYMQEYLTAGVARKPKKNAKRMTVRIPIENLFTEQTVDYMQQRKAAVQTQIQGKIKHEA